MGMIERLQFKNKCTSVIVNWVRMKSLTIIFLAAHVNGRTALNVSVYKKSFKVLKVIVSFCFISLKSNSEDSDTGTVLVHCTIVDNIYIINRAPKVLIPACPSDN